MTILKISLLAIALTASLAAPSCERHQDSKANEDQLFEAIYENDAGRVETLLRNGTNPEGRGVVVDTKLLGGAGIYPLHCAANFRRSEIAAILLRYGAAPNIRSRTEEVPLHYSARLGDIATARVLLSAGADPNAADRTCTTVLQLAQRSGQEQFAAFLLSSGTMTHAHYTLWQKYWHGCQ